MSANEIATLSNKLGITSPRVIRLDIILCINNKDT